MDIRMGKARMRTLGKKRYIGLFCLLAFHCYDAPAFSAESPSLSMPAGGAALQTQGEENPHAPSLSERSSGGFLAESHSTDAEKEDTISSPDSPAPLPLESEPRIPGGTTLPPLPREWRNSIRRVQLPEGKKWISFTFDLCERENETAGYDADVVSALRANNVKASFFASGKWMRSHPEQARQLLADPLFELGGHGWAHENFRLLDKAEAEKKFLHTQAFYEVLRKEVRERSGSDETPMQMERVPIRPRIFRFPFGTCNGDSLDMLAAHGVAAIQWDVVSGDAAKGRTARGIAEVVLKQSKPGSIVIFHANGRGHGTAKALPGLISSFRDRGFEFVTVSELLAAGTPVTSSECYELRPGDNRRYDKFK